MEVDRSKLIRVNTPHELVDGFPPVRHLMYCAEQIIIPQPFPNILKNYAKACIRTQPYDLLRWSAAYFRCLADHVPPPVKQRVERQCRFGTLTRGYLRTLLQQLGKGFFVNRDVLQARWQSLALPEDELLCFLSLGRMLHWPQVHWLKLFAVMVGSLNASLLETLTMLCELLTDEVEGSPAPIPMWMLRECYVFLAELDCGSQQRFEDGRKVIGDGVLEEPSTMPDLPKLLSLEAFRNAIVEKFNERLGIEHSHCRHDYPYRLDELGVRDASAVGADADNCADSATGSRPSTASSSRPSHVSSSFRFVGDYADATQVIKRTPDFDSVILLLHEAQGFDLHRYSGAHAIGAKTLRHAQRREAELRDRREHQARLVLETAGQITAADHDALLADIEPPWSWMHQFAASNCRAKSYNFLEFQSIASAETPPESSDESFDFERSRFHRAPPSASDASCERGIEEMLLTSAGGRLAFSDDGYDEEAVTMRIVDVPGLLGDVMQMIERAVVRKEIELQNTQSVASFVLTNEPATYTAADARSALNLGAIRVAIRHADDQHMVFHDLDELRGYLQAELRLQSTEATTTSATQSLVSADASEHLLDVSPMTAPTAAAAEPDVPAAATETAAADSRAPLVDKFDDCQLEVEEKLLRKPLPGEMILGIVGTPPATPIRVPTPPRTPTEPPSTPHDTSSGIISGNVSLHEFPAPYAEVAAVEPPAPLPREPFCCDVPPMAGIGAAVSKRTICNWVTYLTGRARDERGLVFPRHFGEEECPAAVDTFET